jgi:hypothetical protein
MQLDIFEVSYQQQLLEMIPNEKRIFGDIEVVYEGEKIIFNWRQPDHVWSAYKDGELFFVGSSYITLCLKCLLTSPKIQGQRGLMALLSHKEDINDGIGCTELIRGLRPRMIKYCDRCKWDELTQSKAIPDDKPVDDLEDCLVCGGEISEAEDFDAIP